MGELSKIQWTTHTFNPWIGCDKVSAGCKNCYAEVETSSRVSKARGLPLWGPKAARHRTKTWGDPKRWNRKAFEARAGAEFRGVQYERPRVFCASLCDVFEGRGDLDPWRAELWPLIEACDELDWMLLTKRPENILRMVPAVWLKSLPSHVWIGTSVEDQDAADERIPHLLNVPARVRFLSMEPLLAGVDLSTWIAPVSRCGGCSSEHEGMPKLCPSCDEDALITAWGETQLERLRSGERYNNGGPHIADDGPQVHLVIVGGEGHGGRPCDLAWIRSIVAQCKEAGVACFVKQFGSNPHQNVAEAAHYGSIGALKHPKGGDPSEWPADLRVRQMPEVSR